MPDHPICTYQHFDPVSLAPQSVPTQRRIGDLAPLVALASGRSVLDIGCNAGLVSALALRAGARSVLSTDVDPNFVAATSSLTKHHAGQWEVRKLAFEAHSATERADVVYFLEVYHWLLHQGMSPEAVAEKLDLLTGQVLVLEAPWDATDPSVAASLKHVHYSLPPLLQALQSAGFRIELVGFASYFAAEYQRAMFRCERRLGQSTDR